MYVCTKNHLLDSLRPLDLLRYTYQTRDELKLVSV